MLDFDERDLVALAERAGFFPIRLELEAEVRSSEPIRWDTYVDTAGNPRIPTLAEAMREALTLAERERLTTPSPPTRRGGSRHVANGDGVPPRDEALTRARLD
jgi:arsenite methyltransferase